MLRILFVILAELNKVLLPKISKKNLNKLSAFDKLVIGIRYWVTKNSLPN